MEDKFYVKIKAGLVKIRNGQEVTFIPKALFKNSIITLKHTRHDYVDVIIKTKEDLHTFAIYSRDEEDRDKEIRKKFEMVFNAIQ